MKKLVTIVISFIFTVLLSANVFAAGDDANLQLLGSFKRTDAAMGESIPQDTKFADNVRKNIAKFYDKQINVEHKIPFDKRCSYHLYWICVKNRNQFRKELSNRGIETGTHYKPINKMSFYKSTNKILNTEKVAREIVTIPIHPNLTQSQLDYIKESINKFV